MDLVEIRDLDGPNLFALTPTIKLEVSLSPGEQIPAERLRQIGDTLDLDLPGDPGPALSAVITALHERAGLEPPIPVVHELDVPGHIAICFQWNRRSVAMAIAQTTFDLASDEVPEDVDAVLANPRPVDEDADEQPTWVRDDERRIPIAAITATNGKTTTTRLLTHIMQAAGNRVGWSSSTGVYIDGEQVLDGDFTGHGGARRVLTDPTIDCGVLETARGGILLRGLGFESNDVGVFLNVSADHLHLHGITRLETLARAKSTVVRVTRPEGVAVLNADDPLVLALREHVVAEPVLISRSSDNPLVDEHLERGGRAVLVRRGDISFESDGACAVIASLADVPMTYQGAAPHMVENALAAVAAAIGFGIDHQVIREALETFTPDAEHNAGRLNVFEVDGRTIVIDYAHNESGLSYLFDFAGNLFPTSTRCTAVVGTAGDRSDSVFMRLGMIAGERADRIYLKENPRFLRGREPGESLTLLRTGVLAASAPDSFVGAYEREYDATIAALDSSEPGETILVMCIEDYAEIVDELECRGAQVHPPAQQASGA